MHIVRYRKYPNNEIRATHYYSPPAKAVKDEESSVSGSEGLVSCASALDEEACGASPSSLTLGPISASGESNLPHKKTRFGANAKNTLLRIGGAYDTLSTNPSDFIFLTGTLPGDTPAAFRCIAEHSSYIAHSIGKWIKRKIKSDYYFYVWELQKRGALHFHYCVYCPDKHLRSKAIANFKAKWTDLLDDISSRSGVCLWEGSSRTCWRDRYGTLQAYAQEVHTSVAAYLSGYCSNEKNKHAQDESSPYYPSRWWGASRKSSSLLASLTEEVITSHTNYRDAALKTRVHYEQVLHDTPKAHHYQHKVGVGSTVVSYHPQDKGHEIWQGLLKMSLQHKHHPHIVSLIHVCQEIRLMVRPYVSASTQSRKGSSSRVLQDLEDSALWNALQRLTLQETHLTILKTARLHLPSPTCANPHLEQLLNHYKFMEAFLIQNQPYLQFNRYGWLCNFDDLPYTVDNSVLLAQSSTTDSDRAEALGETANGSMSPLNLPLQQLDLWHSSD